MLLQFFTFDDFNESMQISGSDIHLLTVFDCVVRNGGFSAAQAELGLSQPTISNHIAALEERLGAKLCQRGRRGFLLTDKGLIVHEIAQSLINTLDDQSRQLSALKGSLIGRLNIAAVDCSASDPNLKLPEAIRKMAEQAPAVRICMEIQQPQDILNGIADGSFHVGIGSFDNKIAGLRYEDLYDEWHELYCGTDHPIANLPPESLSMQDLFEYPWVHRGYWNRQRQKRIRPNDLDRVVYHIEAQFFLILSGQYLGLLPDHAAEPFVKSGRLKKLPQAEEDYSCVMQVVTRSGPQPKTIELFRSLMKSLYKVT